MKASTIRHARADDAGAVTDLVQAAYTPYLTRMPRRPAPMDDDYAAAIATRDVRVAVCSDAVCPDPGCARRGGAIVGVLVLRHREDDILVENLAIHPSHHGRQIGGALLNLVDEIAHTAGVSTVRLYTNVAMTENLSFYPRHGFAETHRSVDEGYDRVHFAKEISGPRT